MAVDLQACFPQESVTLNDVRVVKYGGLWVVRVEGDDFRAVDEVLINDTASPDVIVLSRTLLTAQLPDMYQTMPEVRSVMVLNKQLTLSPRSLIRFRIGKSPGKVRGILRLMQLFLKVLFTSPGSDIFRPNSGGGLLRSLGTTFGQDEGSNLVSDIVIAVNRTQRQIIAAQSRDQRSPRDERLLTARIISANFDKLQSAFYVKIELVSQAGRTAITNLEL